MFRKRNIIDFIKKKFSTHFSCEKHPHHVLIIRATRVKVTKKDRNDPNDKGDQEETLLVGKFGDIF